MEITQLVSWQGKPDSFCSHGVVVFSLCPILHKSEPQLQMGHCGFSSGFEFDGNPVYFSSKAEAIGEKRDFIRVVDHSLSLGLTLYGVMDAQPILKNEANREKKGIFIEGACPL